MTTTDVPRHCPVLGSSGQDHSGLGTPELETAHSWLKLSGSHLEAITTLQQFGRTSRNCPVLPGFPGGSDQQWSRAKTNRVLPRKCTGHSKHLLPKTQEKTLHVDITRWSTLKSDWLYALQPKMEKLYTVNKNKIGSWLWLRSWTPYSAKFRLKLKKVGETTRPFRYDLNQIPYDYTMEVTNRFKGLDLIECWKNYGWSFMTLYRRQWSRPSPGKKNAKKKMAVWGGFTNRCEKNRSKKQRRKGNIYPFEYRVPKNSKER